MVSATSGAAEIWGVAALRPKAGVMPSVRLQLIAAAEAGRVDVMQTLIAARANVEETHTVSLKGPRGVKLGMMNGCVPGSGESIEVRAQMVPAPDGPAEMNLT